MFEMTLNNTVYVFLFNKIWKQVVFKKAKLVNEY